MVRRVPRARLIDEAGKANEARHGHAVVGVDLNPGGPRVGRYQRLTKKEKALIASVYLAGTNTRRVKRALSACSKGAGSKDVVSRALGNVKTDWEA